MLPMLAGELKREGRFFRICWIPGHSSFPGNEVAYQVARALEERSDPTSSPRTQDPFHEGDTAFLPFD